MDGVVDPTVDASDRTRAFKNDCESVPRFDFLGNYVPTRRPFLFNLAKVSIDSCQN